MSKSTLKQNMSTNQVENAVSLEKSRWFNKPAQKKQVQEMIYIDTIPKIVPIVKTKVTKEDHKIIKAMKTSFKESKNNVKLFIQRQNELCLQIAKSPIPNWENVSVKACF